MDCSWFCCIGLVTGTRMGGRRWGWTMLVRGQDPFHMQQQCCQCKYSWAPWAPILLPTAPQEHGLPTTPSEPLASCSSALHTKLEGEGGCDNSKGTIAGRDVSSCHGLSPYFHINCLHKRQLPAKVKYIPNSLIKMRKQVAVCQEFYNVNCKNNLTNI